jgi:GT2 family glycosyltransferase
VKRSKKISIVIPTYGRGDLLCETLADIVKQDYPDYEVIVVDQNGSSASCLLELTSKEPKIRHFRIRERGLPNARNYGVLEAKGEVVIFCDDDVILSKGFIGHHAKNYCDEAVAGVAGRVVARGLHSADQMLEHNQARIAKIRWFGLCQYDNFDSKIQTYADHAQGCNMSFRRDVIIKLGGFDKRFGGSAHLEETDFCIRLREAGYRMVFDPKAELIHLKDSLGGCRAGDWGNWFYWYGHNYGLLYAKNNKLACLLIGIKALHILMSALKRRDVLLFFGGIRGMREGVLKTSKKDGYEGLINHK